MWKSTPPSQKLDEENLRMASQRVKSLLRGFREVLVHHRCPTELLHQILGRISDWLQQTDESTFVKRAKYVLCFPMAAYLRQVELPENPRPGEKIFPGGNAGQWIKNRLKAFNRSNTHLWFSWFQAKRSCEPLSEDMVFETFRKHRQAMKIEDPIDEETRSGMQRVLRPMINAVRAALKPSFRSIDSVLNDMSANACTFKESIESVRWRLDHVASVNASYAKSRGAGGQMEDLRERMSKRTRQSLSSISLAFDALSKIIWRPIALVNGLVRSNASVEHRSYPFLLEDWKEMLYAEVRHSAVRDTEPICEFTDSIRERFCGRAEVINLGDPLAKFPNRFDHFPSYRCRAMVEAVLEPLKIRTISKGPAAHYYFSKPLQKKIHSIMRDMSPFKLIGRPVCPTDLIDVAKNCSYKCEFTEKLWASGDFVASTDNISASLSKWVMEELVADFPEDMKEIFLSVLAPHVIDYPKDSEVPSVVQKNGQLMGSILSFPILCLINYGMYLYTLEKIGDARPESEKMKGVLVNGDDILFVANNEMWKIFGEVGRKVGLSLSPGKAYLHREYANINSTSFHYNLERPGETPWQIGFLNTGLFFAQQKVLGKMGRDQEEQDLFLKLPHIAPINKLLDGCVNEKGKYEVLRRFMHEHREAIEEEAQGRNLFLPISLGGFGVYKPKAWKTKISRDQLQWANSIIAKNVDYVIPDVRPYPSGLIEKLDSKVECPWSVRQKEYTDRRVRGLAACPSSLMKYGIVLGNTILKSLHNPLGLNVNGPKLFAHRAVKFSTKGDQLDGLATVHPGICQETARIADKVHNSYEGLSSLIKALNRRKSYDTSYEDYCDDIEMNSPSDLGGIQYDR